MFVLGIPMLKVIPSLKYKKNTHTDRSNLGRLVMADPLCYLKELALKEVNPRLFTIATLTGHAARTYGDNYTVKF